MEGLRSGCIGNIFLTEVVLDAFRLFLDAAQRADGGARQRRLGSWWGGLGHTLLQVRVEQLIRVQLRRVTRQIEDRDLIFVFREPFLHGLGVVYAQVIQDQEDPLFTPRLSRSGLSSRFGLDCLIIGGFRSITIAERQLVHTANRCSKSILPDKSSEVVHMRSGKQLPIQLRNSCDANGVSGQDAF